MLPLVSGLLDTQEPAIADVGMDQSLHRVGGSPVHSRARWGGPLATIADVVIAAVELPR